MKISYSWLNELVEHLPDPMKLAEILTMRGFEVEEITSPGADIQDVVVGKILDCKQHPNADKLSLCQVTDGEQTYPIVCGAKNMKTGDHVALARVGSILPGSFKIEARKLRGETSMGMLCSSRELGLGDDHSGIIILSEETRIGNRLVDEIGLNETIYELNITPNRPDVLSALGVAREVAAACSATLRLPDCSPIPASIDPDFIPSITLEAPDL